jgi:hypothetical protein
MFKTIERPADCEIRSVIRFLNARNVKPADIHRQICEVYGENAMSDGMVGKWVRQFNEGRENAHDEARSGRPCRSGCLHRRLRSTTREYRNWYPVTINASIMVDTT